MFDFLVVLKIETVLSVMSNIREDRV